MSPSQSIVRRPLGKGTVDVLVPTDSLSAGEPTDIAVEFTGRDVQERLTELTLTLDVPYRTETGFERTTVDTVELAADLTVEGLSGTQSRTVTLPRETPGTLGSIGVIGTFAFVTDRRRDIVDVHLDVAPDARIMSAFFAMFDLGFGLENLDCVADISPDGQPYTSRFEYRPVEGPFEEAMETVELFVRHSAAPPSVCLTVDRDDGPVDLSRIPDGETTLRRSDDDAIRDQLRRCLEGVCSASAPEG